MRTYFPFVAWGILLLAVGGGIGLGQELPKPTLDNSLIVSIEHPPTDVNAVNAIKSSFSFGLYAWLSFSLTYLAPDLAWTSDWTQADTGIQRFKSNVNTYIAAAKTAGVRFHLVVCSGLSRGLYIYLDAKKEDIRNAQWYNDNNLASAAQAADADFLSKHVFSTFSRYALKLRRNLEAKSRAMAAFLKQRIDQEPDVLAAVSGWGEAELSDRRIDYALTYPEFFCDYSPFAVLEFRDWLQHGGLYDDAAGKYAGQGYSGGGAKYAGPAGLAQFNSDFGSSFTTWDLKYFHWNLADGEGGAIPIAEYVQGGMMPTSGPRYIAGGFDPPRVIQPGNAFWRLWNQFRETMVRNLLLDLGSWVADAGIDPQRWFTHQIPADYLFGSNPASEPKNARYYSSASPFWTADIGAYASLGATMYDVKFPDWFARTSQFLLPDARDRNSRWAIMEYDAEVYPASLPLVQSSSDFILEQYLKAYRARPSLINFWRWADTTGESQIRGMNKETALRELVNRIRDKAGSTDLTVVYSPPKVVGLSAAYIPAEGGVKTQIGGAIWTDAAWAWKTWGDFSHFEVYRGDAAGFPADPAHKLGQTSDYQHLDATALALHVYYYRWRAVNKSGVAGPLSDVVSITTSTTPAPVLTVDKTNLIFGAQAGGASPAARVVLIRNAGPAGTSLNWTAAADKTWIGVSPAAGVGNGAISVTVNPGSLGAGSYDGRIEVRDSGAVGSPRFVEVELTVYEQGADEAPFGRFDTPADGALVASSIPVTGWALDDIGVDEVEIKRHPVAGDPVSAIDADGLVFVGNAVFVRGARPDVEAAYPGTPQADRAGWGYMLLTNFLPNQGNGTFVLRAVAVDSSGNRRSLGEKTITADNAHAVKPFGAIDTPGQGGLATGSLFYNFGWVLTPPPNSIPGDGSTIWVWVDSVPLGHPSYGHYRDDVATLFPGYLNSDGAIGVYELDTTAYENGVHTIVWSARDSGGNEDGIGSRYFEISNPGAPAPAASASQLPVAGWSGVALEGGVKPEITVEELGRIRFRLRGPDGALFLGWGHEEGRPLPVGSTLKPGTGEFFWIPGPGFLGEHVLHFAATDGSTRSLPLRVTIRIVPKSYPRRAEPPIR